jgi:hypothetical protein
MDPLELLKHLPGEASAVSDRRPVGASAGASLPRASASGGDALLKHVEEGVALTDRIAGRLADLVEGPSAISR